MNVLDQLRFFKKSKFSKPYSGLQILDATLFKLLILENPSGSIRIVHYQFNLIQQENKLILSLDIFPYGNSIRQQFKQQLNSKELKWVVKRLLWFRQFYNQDQLYYLCRDWEVKEELTPFIFLKQWPKFGKNNLEFFYSRKKKRLDVMLDWKFNIDSFFQCCFNAYRNQHHQRSFKLCSQEQDYISWRFVIDENIHILYEIEILNFSKILKYIELNVYIVGLIGYSYVSPLLTPTEMKKFQTYFNKLAEINGEQELRDLQTIL